MKQFEGQYKEIDTVTQLLGLITETGPIDSHVFQNVDFTDLEDLASQCTYTNCLFLGCTLPDGIAHALDKSNLVFPRLDAPFDIYRSYLYSANSLYAGFDPRDESTDHEFVRLQGASALSPNGRRLPQRQGNACALSPRPFDQHRHQGFSRALP